MLQKGDVLLSVSFGGKTEEIIRQHHAIDMMLDVRVGDVVAFEILRNGEKRTVQITVTAECLVAY